MSTKPIRSCGWVLGVAAMMALCPWEATAQAPKPQDVKPSVDLKTASAVAYDGAVQAIRQWVKWSRIDDGKVVPPSAIVPPKALTSSASIADDIRKYMIDKGVSYSVAQSFGEPIGAAFNAWANSYSTNAPAAFATLPFVPPGLNVQVPCSCTPPHPLRLGASPGEVKMTPPALSAALKASIKTSTADAPHIDALAGKLAARFQKWQLTATLGNLKAIPKPVAPGAPTIIWGLKGMAVIGGPAF